MADAAKVEQVRLNLFSNAVKFTPSGGSVTLSCVATETDVHVLVQDTGVGIPLDRRGEVFEPFVQLDRSLVNPREGVGLGLAISQDAKGLQVIAHAPVGPHARPVVPSCLGVFAVKAVPIRPDRLRQRRRGEPLSFVNPKPKKK